MLQLAGQWQGLRVSQPQYNLLSRLIEEEYEACSRRFELSNIVYNPLAGGLLTGKHHVGDQPVAGTRFSQAGYRQRYWHPAMFEAVERLSAVATGVGLSPIELSYRWLLARPLVTCVIVGASSPEQLATNLAAALGPELDQETRDLIDDIWASLRGPAPRYNR
jgi:aryl-alcohol dehydrogenase-like predicted oxidoreductase